MTKKRSAQEREKKEKVLVVEESKEISHYLCDILNKEGYMVVSASNLEQIRNKLKTEIFSVAFLSLNHPDINEAKLINTVKRKAPECEIIIITTTASIKASTKIISQKSLEYLIDPFDATEIKIKVSRAIDRRELLIKNNKLVEELKDYEQKLHQKIFIADKRLKTSNLQLKQTYEELKEVYDHSIHDRQQLTSVNKELIDKVDQLTTLDQIGETVRQTIRLEKRLEIILKNISKCTGFDRSSIMLLDKSRKTLQYVGSNKEISSNGKNIFHMSIFTGNSIFAKAISEKKIYNIKDVTKEKDLNKKLINTFKFTQFVVVPLIARGNSIGIMLIDNPTSKRPITNADIKLINRFTTQVAIAIENSQLYEEILEENLRTKKDLKMANRIQQSLLPENYPKLDRIKIWAKCQPARMVGGDFYLFREFRKGDDKLGIVIGDVSGKGISAALIMAMVTNTIKNLSQGRDIVLPDVFSVVNKAIIKYLPESSDMFITAFYGVIDLKNNIFRYSKAGHYPPLLFHRGKYIPLQVKRGFPLGEFKNCSFKNNEIKITGGLKIIFYTDGITETINNSGKMLGLDRLKEIIATNSTLSPKKLGEHILKKIEKFQEKQPQADDLTLVIVEIEK